MEAIRECAGSGYKISRVDMFVENRSQGIVWLFLVSCPDPYLQLAGSSQME